MTSVLDRARKPAREPFVGTFVGVQGTGKTTLACTFPKVIMVRTIGEKPPYDVPDDQVPDVIGVATSDQLWDVFKALAEDDHGYQTVVFDTVTGLDAMFTQDVLDADPNARGLNQSHGGYGNGASMVVASHLRVRKFCEILRRRRGMHVVFLAHAEIGDVSPPDGDPYSAYALRLPKKSTAPYLDSVDCVGFLKQDRVVRGSVEAKNDRAARPGRAVSSGDRTLVTYLTPAAPSKNRYGITEDLDVVKGQNPLAPWIGLEVAAEPDKPKRQSAARKADKALEPAAQDDNHDDDAAEAARDAMENA